MRKLMSFYSNYPSGHYQHIKRDLISLQQISNRVYHGLNLSFNSLIRMRSCDLSESLHIINYCNCPMTTVTRVAICVTLSEIIHALNKLFKRNSKNKTFLFHSLLLLSPLSIIYKSKIQRKTYIVV